MRAGRIEKTNALAVQISKRITQRHKSRLIGLSHKTDAKSVWKAVRQVTGTKHSVTVADGISAESQRPIYQLIRITLTQSTRTDDENRQLCTDFSNFFTDKIVKLRASVSDRLSALLPSRLSFLAHNGSVLNKLDPVTADEVHKLLSSSLPKSSNIDLIPTYLVLRCQSVFSEIIARLANLSFSEGRFPGKFKQASVTLSNYRPISNLNFISELLERFFLSLIDTSLHAGQTVPLRLPCSFLIAYILCPMRGNQSYSFC